MNYSSLAPLYDRVMAHVEYDQWLTLIRKIALQYLFGTDSTILELGAGTGTLGRMLKEYGFSYYGSDLSFSMCKEAQAKGLPFFCADAKMLPVKKNVSLILFLYDGINYLTTLQEYAQLFSGVHSCLDTHGCFLFDITTESNSKNNFIDSINAEDFSDSAYVRHSYYDTKHKIQHNDFTIYSQHPVHHHLYMKQYEYHRQRVFGVQEIISVIPKTLFCILGIWDSFSFRKHTHRSERIHFLLQKIATP